MAARELHTPRLRLRIWQDADRHALTAMHADPEVMADLGGPIAEAASNAKLDAYRDAFQSREIGRWLVETRGGEFLGYVGIMPLRDDHPLGDGLEIGWRLVRSAWGQGFATEAAASALRDAFNRPEVREVFAYTAASNLQSRAVMARLGLRRERSLDYVDENPARPGPRFVWVADHSWNAVGLQGRG